MGAWAWLPPVAPPAAERCEGAAPAPVLGVVDQVDGSVALVVLEDGALLYLDRAVLPAGAGEGDALALVRVPRPSARPRSSTGRNAHDRGERR